MPNMTDKVVIDVYFVHSVRLKERESVMQRYQNLMNSLSKAHTNISFHFNKISKYEAEDMPAIARRIFSVDSLKETENQFYNGFKMSSCSVEMLSNAMKHVEALNLISTTYELPNTTYHYMVLEDDIAFDEDIHLSLERLLRDTTLKEYDFVFLGLPGESPSESPEKAASDTKPAAGLSIVSMGKDLSNKITPVCDAYIITKRMASQLVQIASPIRYPFNIQLSYILDKTNGRIGRVYPNLTLDGSKFGNFPSTITPNNILLFNPVYKLIYKVLEKSSLHENEVDRVRELFDKHGNRSSPDFIFLEGLFFLRIREFENCKNAFDKAIEMYKAMHSPVNKSSLIVLNYIELCRQMQIKSLQTQADQEKSALTL